MNLKEYFSDKKGVGVMATSDANGVIDTAIYSRPHVEEKDIVAFIMREHLTHKNLQETKHANYLFLEDSQGYQGVRLFLTKIDETTDTELIQAMTRRHLTPEEDCKRGPKHLVRFQVDKVHTLVGGDEILLEQ
ncbi:MAG: pyridoxamine 5'-phosphate oxidase family protein [Proteobacteria bacterium]|nr:pyridoxamine 5'-phosphate oxidase family protein [Pseudomonadota bacterium]MBU1638997.1 pyridoxamine 5'-phosphate oxidase family protein [Pseudomonadota bacterium]